MLTRFSDYALRVLMFAALRREGAFSVGEVADAYQLSKNHLAKVVNHLVRTGHLRARRGRKGGVWLDCDPRTVRLGELVRQTENDSPLVECFAAESNRCRLAPGCRLKGAMAQALDAFYRSLDKCTLADLVAEPATFRALFEEAP